MKKGKCKFVYDKSKLGEKLKLVYCGKKTKNKKEFCDLHQEDRIFSGDDSRLMWDEINSIKNEKVQDALYSIACKCQELEAVVRKLRKEKGG